MHVRQAPASSEFEIERSDAKAEAMDVAATTGGQARRDRLPETMERRACEASARKGSRSESA